jgi:hypothetical protein
MSNTSSSPRANQALVSGARKSQAVTSLPSVLPSDPPEVEIDTLLQVVADSWDRLRSCDLDRLVDVAREAGSINQLLQAVKTHRPDLSLEADKLASEFP